jgi:DNA-binding LacI/PurR family transcriptional regulator
MPETEPPNPSQNTTSNLEGLPQAQSSQAHERLQMADIARLAGVSLSTVSRALSGSTLVNAKTREKIHQLAQQMNYTVNLSARNLRLQDNRTVAVVVPYDPLSRQHISDPFFLSIVGSIADALTDAGYDMLLSRVNADHLDAAGRLYDSGKAEGLIIIGQWRHHDQLNDMAARRVPLVVWGAELPKQLYCSVGGDNALGGLLATRHLIGTGRRKIAFLGDTELPEVYWRHQGYVQALREAGAEVDPRLQLSVPFEPQAAREAVNQLCRSGVDFDAVFACSDLLALQTLKSLRSHNREVPTNVAVVGYDDMPLASFSDPPLTTIHQPIGDAGVALVDALISLLHQKTALPRTLPVHLVRRETA